MIPVKSIATQRTLSTVAGQKGVMHMNLGRLREVIRRGYRISFKELLVEWCARRDSNPQPLGPKPSALSFEPRARILFCASVTSTY